MSYDPFGDTASSAPALKFPTVGDKYTITITDVSEPYQGKDFETGLPATFRSGRPKLTYKVTGTVDGEERALYVTQYSNLARAISEAVAAAKCPLALGGVLDVAYTGDVPVENHPHMKAKGYAARYAPGAPAPAADPFGEKAPF